MPPHEIEQLRLRTHLQTGLVLRHAEMVEREIADSVVVTLGLGSDYSYAITNNVIPFERRGRQLPGSRRRR